MNRRVWIIVIAVVAVIAAVVIGIVVVTNDNGNDTSKTEAINTFCGSLKTLETSVQSLTGLSSSSSKDEYQSDVTAVQTAWDQVKTDAQAVQDAPTGDLDSAWNDFDSAIKDVPNDASVTDAVNDIKQSGQALVSTAQTTASQVNCSSSSSTTTTSP